MVNIVNSVKLKILCSSDHPSLFKFCLLVVNIVRNYKILICTVSNSLGNMKALEPTHTHTPQCEILIFRYGVLCYLSENADIETLRLHCSCHRVSKMDFF